METVTISPQAPSSPPPSINPDEKILKDLSALSEQIALCQSLLSNLGPAESISSSSSEALLTVIGFLEACVPRMVELIEAGSGGAFDDGDGTLVKCLEVNDELVKVLKDVEVHDKCGGDSVGGSAENIVTSQPDTLEEVNFGSFKIEDDDDDKVTDDDMKGIQDFLDEDSGKRPGAAALEDLLTTPNVQNNEKDPFDDFLGERMNGKA